MLAPATQVSALLAELDKATKEGLPTAKFIPALGFNIVSAYIVRNCPVAEVEEFLTKHQARLSSVVISELEQRKLPELIVKHCTFNHTWSLAKASMATNDFSRFEERIVNENWKANPEKYLTLLPFFDTTAPNISQTAKDWVQSKIQDFAQHIPASYKLESPNFLGHLPPEAIKLLLPHLTKLNKDDLQGTLKRDNKPVPAFLEEDQTPKAFTYYRHLLSSTNPVLHAEALKDFDYRNPQHYPDTLPEDIEMYKNAFRTHLVGYGAGNIGGPDKKLVINYYLSHGETLESLQQLAAENGCISIVNSLQGRPEPTLRKDWTAIEPGVYLNDAEQAERWKAFNGPADWAASKYESPLGFKPSLYTELLPVTTALFVAEGGEFEQPNDGAKYAFRLATIFSNSQEALQFLDKHKNRKSEQPIHDLLQHPLPEHSFSKDRWKGFIQKFGTPALELLAWAPNLDKDPTFVPTSLTQVRAAAVEIGYKRSKEAPALAQLAMEYKLPENTFNTYVELTKVAVTDKTLPKTEFEIKDGTDTYKWRMLSPKDPEFYVIGNRTECCMRHKYAGYTCLVHAATQPHSCMYVLENVTNPAKPVVTGGTWAWRGKDNEIVLDSWERHSKSPVADLALKTFSAKAGAPVYLGIGGAGGKDFNYQKSEAKPVLENPPAYMADSNKGVYEVPKLIVERPVGKDKARELVGMDR